MTSPEAEILAYVNDEQKQASSRQYSKVLKKLIEPAKNLTLAKKAAESLKIFLKSIYDADLSGAGSLFFNRPPFKIIFEFSESGEIFLKCTNTKPDLDVAVQKLQECEQKLKELLGDDVQIDHIPITRINNSPTFDTHIEGDENSATYLNEI